MVPADHVCVIAETAFLARMTLSQNPTMQTARLCEMDHSIRAVAGRYHAARLTPHEDEDGRSHHICVAIATC
jgi:hypothetical protein